MFVCEVCYLLRTCEQLWELTFWELPSNISYFNCCGCFELCHNGWELFGNFREHFLFLLQCYPFIFFFFFRSTLLGYLDGVFSECKPVLKTVLVGVGWGGVGGQIVWYYRFLVLKKSLMRILFLADSLFVVGGTTLGWGGPWNWVGNCARICAGGGH